MNVLFIDEVGRELPDLFQAKGWNCDFRYSDSRETLKNDLHLYDGIIIRSRFRLDADFLSATDHLKFIGRPGAGLENIDLSYCEANDIAVFRSPEGNRDAVAEHIIGGILTLFNNIRRADVEVRKGVWKREPNRGIELMGKTVGIIGFGYMGAAFAKRLQGFGVNIIAYDKYKTDYAPEYVKEVELSEIFEYADVVSLHIPQTDETVGMVNSAWFSKFRKPIYLINSARGTSVVLEDLLEALKKEKVLGAVLDVLEYESSAFENTGFDSPTFKELSQLENIVFTPHIAGWTHEANTKMSVFLGEKIIGFVGDE